MSGTETGAAAASRWATRAELRRLWDDYVQHSTVHGVVYVGGANSTAKERLVWAAALAGLIAVGYHTCGSALFGDDVYSTTTVVSNAHLPVNLFAFPALSLCPLNKVRRTIGEQLLLRHLGLPVGSANRTLRAQLIAVMRALSFLEMTQMANIKPSLLRAFGPIPILPRLANLNVTDFMLKVLPTCRQLFSRCTWHDAVEDCCDLLHLQQSDFGYCYSFNSLSALRSRHCKTKGNHANALSTSTSTISATTSPECELRRINSFGPGSALHVYLGELNDSDIVQYRRQRGLVVCVHQNVDLPMPTAGFLLPARDSRQLELAIGIENTVADREVLQLPVPLRRCLKPSESANVIAGTYSSETCKLECKLQYVFEMCGCVPYMFAMNRYPPCHIGKIMCLGGLDVVKMVLPPFTFPNDAIKRRGLNCSHCIRSCEVVSYQFLSKSRKDHSDPFVTRAGAVSVHIDIGAGAKMYRTKLDRNFVDRLTIIGSVAGLALGVSIVSAIEATYYLLKAGLVLARPFLEMRVKWPRRLLNLDLVRVAQRAHRMAERHWPRRRKPPAPTPSGATQHV